MKWVEATAEELAKAARNKKTIVFLPLGNIESHGFHLPAGTDSLTVQAFCGMLEKKLEEQGFAPVVLPVLNQAIRSLPEFNLDLPLDLYAKVIRTTLLKIMSNGFRNIVLVVGHTPNIEVAKTVAREVAAQERAKIVCFDWYALGDSTGFEDVRHAGDAETSALAYFYPELVRKEKVFDNPAEAEKKPPHYWASVGGARQRVGKKAVLGLPSRHSREKGRRFVESALEKAVEIIEKEF